MARRRRRSTKTEAREERRVKDGPEPLVTDTAHKANARRLTERHGSQKRSRAARHPVVILANFVVLFIVMAMIGGVALLVAGRNAYLAEGPLGEDVAVVIDRGSSVQAIATGLEERGVIENRYVFLAAAVWSGAKNTLQAGEYRIPAGSSMADVLARIASGDVVQHTITIAEGLSSVQVVQRLLADEVLSGPLEEIPPDGTLLPETYQFSRGMTRERLIETMTNAMDRAVDEAWSTRDANLPLAAPAELVTLASIVEKETGAADERARVAGVFVNRLKRDMRLQSDPTILYGLYGGEAWLESRTIYQSDLDRQNPYNTYQIDGLPPGPIANPGREALFAVAQPAVTEDLFFVADGTGGHAFAVTYEEHQQNVARWRAIEADQRSARTRTE